MPRANQAQGASRILLEPHLREVVEEIQERCQVKSPSQAIALMISRYSRHLLETWELDPQLYPDPSPSDFLPAQQTPDDFTFNEPISL
ncbi:MAG: hypothetical protein WBA57_27590 [Elainellaceae cyanobacterium]